MGVGLSVDLWRVMIFLELREFNSVYYVCHTDYFITGYNTENDNSDYMYIDYSKTFTALALLFSCFSYS